MGTSKTTALLRAHRVALWLIPLPALLAGACKGMAAMLLFHYGAFQARLPNANQQWWNPALSWTNKGDCFLCQFNTTFTDAYHLFDHTGYYFLWPLACAAIAASVAVLAFDSMLRGRHLLLWGFVYFLYAYACHQAAFHLVYTLAFR